MPNRITKQSSSLLGTSLSAIALSLSLMFAPLPVQSGCCGDGPVAEAGAESAGSMVASAITEAVESIIMMIEELQKGLGETSGKVQEAVQKQAATQKSVLEGRIAVEEQNRMTEVSGDIITQFLSENIAGGERACFDRNAGIKAAQSFDKIGPNHAELAIRASTDAAGVPDVGLSLAKRLEEQESLYGEGGSKAQWQGAHLNAAVTLMSGANDAIDQDGLEASMALIENIVGRPRMALADAASGNPINEQGKAVIGSHLTDAARRGVSRATLDQQARIRVANPAFTPESLGMTIAGMSGDQPLSLLQVMTYYVASRFTNPGWHANTRGLGVTGLLREINSIQSYQLFQNFMLYKAFERFNTNLSSQNAILAEMVAITDEGYVASRHRAVRIFTD